jgi:hypothetical protein
MANHILESFYQQITENSRQFETDPPWIKQKTKFSILHLRDLIWGKLHAAKVIT